MRRHDRCGSGNDNDIDAAADEIGGVLEQPLPAAFRETEFGLHGLSKDMAAVAQALNECRGQRIRVRRSPTPREETNTKVLDGDCAWETRCAAKRASDPAMTRRRLTISPPCPACRSYICRVLALARTAPS